MVRIESGGFIRKEKSSCTPKLPPPLHPFQPRAATLEILLSSYCYCESIRRSFTLPLTEPCLIGICLDWPELVGQKGAETLGRKQYCRLIYS